MEKKNYPLSCIQNARLPGRDNVTRWDIHIKHGFIEAITPAPADRGQQDIQDTVMNARGRLAGPSLCHAHVHLDKCFLLHDEKYADLQIKKGDFAEAMSLTGEAKSQFQEDDLLRRGRRLIKESIKAGVTAMRAFVEVDEIVGFKCVHAGMKLKQEFQDSCYVQLCVFAQLALFSGPDSGQTRRKLLVEAACFDGVEVIGSTPYVEEDQEKAYRNIKWMCEQALDKRSLLDLHLDYNLDAKSDSMIPTVCDILKKNNILQSGKTSHKHQSICLGHCTRCALFNKSDWVALKKRMDGLSFCFVGLPNSDIFMMGRREEAESTGVRMRGTLPIPYMINEQHLDACISINNVGNAFTPFGSCDPLALASSCIGIYQSGTKADAELLYECVSTRANCAIRSHEIESSTKLEEHQEANMIIYGDAQDSEAFPNPRSIAELIYCPTPHRQVIYKGCLVSST